jgi:very-short-patch-repair endonuclease
VRGHREGSVYQRGRDGLWVAAISLPGGQRRRAYAKTRAEVEAKLRKMQAVETFLGPTIPAPPTMILPPSLSGARRTTLPTRLGPQYLAIAAESGWIVRSVPEARIAVVLGRLGLTPWNTAAQYKVGRLRIDFAAPDVSVAIEVDGPHHRLPEKALKDIERDATLTAAGWMVFRVDAYCPDDELDHRLGRIVRFIRAERLSR